MNTPAPLPVRDYRTEAQRQQLPPAPTPITPLAAPQRTITRKLARNGYYQVFANGELIGHVYLNPKAVGWLARVRFGTTESAHRTRDAAVAHVAQVTK